MKRIFALIIAIGLLLNAKTQSAEKILVGTSIDPIAFLIEQIGKEKVDVFVMIPPGGNPHTYEPTPKQLKQLSHAQLFVKVGTNIEFELAWMDKLISLNKKMDVCDASKDIFLIEMIEHKHEHHHHERKDPHIWLSPSNAITMANNIRDAFIKIDPKNEDFYINNTSQLTEELNALKKFINEKLSGLKNRTFLIFHPSWGYFANEFNLKQIAIEQNGKEPAPQQVLQIIQQVKDLNIQTVFASPQFSKKSAKVISQEINGKVTLLDTLSKDYIQNLRKASEAFVHE